MNDLHEKIDRLLHEQTFGFTQADVDLLEAKARERERLARFCPPGYSYSIGEVIIDDKPSEDIAALRSLASRIAALLPPQGVVPQALSGLNEG